MQPAIIFTDRPWTTATLTTDAGVTITGRPVTNPRPGISFDVPADTPLDWGARFVLAHGEGFQGYSLRGILTVLQGEWTFLPDDYPAQPLPPPVIIPCPEPPTPIPPTPQPPATEPISVLTDLEVGIINAIYQKFKTDAHGDEDQRRGVTKKMNEQLKHSSNRFFGCKARSSTAPQGKDTLACGGPAGFYWWDWQNGITGLPQVSAGQEGGWLTDQFYIAVEPVNHLGL